MTEAPRASGLCKAKRLLPAGQQRVLCYATAGRLLLLAAAAFLPAACTAISATTGGGSLASAPAEAATPTAPNREPSGIDTAETEPAAEAVTVLAAAATPATTFASHLKRLHGLSADDLR